MGTETQPVPTPDERIAELERQRDIWRERADEHERARIRAGNQSSEWQSRALALEARVRDLEAKLEQAARERNTQRVRADSAERSCAELREALDSLSPTPPATPTIPAGEGGQDAQQGRNLVGLVEAYGDACFLAGCAPAEHEDAVARSVAAVAKPKRDLLAALTADGSQPAPHLPEVSEADIQHACAGLEGGADAVIAVALDDEGHVDGTLRRRDAAETMLHLHDLALGDPDAPAPLRAWDAWMLASAALLAPSAWHVGKYDEAPAPPAAPHGERERALEPWVASDARALENNILAWLIHAQDAAERGDDASGARAEALANILRLVSDFAVAQAPAPPRHRPWCAAANTRFFRDLPCTCGVDPPMDRPHGPPVVLRVDDDNPPQRGPGFGFGHVVPEGAVQAPARYRRCGTTHVNDTTGLVAERCCRCGGTLDHLPAASPPSPTGTSAEEVDR